MSRWKADSWAYRKERRIYLALNPVCALCGHAGASEIDHRIPVGPPHYGDPLDKTNWQPAHGSAGPCSVCHRCCNQIRSNRVGLVPARRSRSW